MYKLSGIERKGNVIPFQGIDAGSTPRIPRQIKVEIMFFKKKTKKTKLCLHKYETYENNSAKRRCVRCGAVEWIMQRRPSFDKPSLTWKFMYYREE